MKHKKKRGLDITCIIVGYKQQALIERSVGSLRRFYPDLPILLVDNGSEDASTSYIAKLASEDPNVRALFLPANYGHGPAMHLAIEQIKTRYAFTLDSDTETNRGGFLELMLERFDPDTYAVGLLIWCDDNGYNVKAGEGWDYIHPSAALVDTWKYRTLPPYVHHGAPCIKNFIAANKLGLLMKDFPILDYITHFEKGTRSKVGGWSPNVLPVDIHRPFVSFVTRTHKRPKQLSRCLESIAAQTDPDYENVIIVDLEGVGVAKANGFFNEQKNRVHGRFVSLVDDDDMVSPDFVETIKCICRNDDPEIIVIKVQHPGVILPDDRTWNARKLEPAHVGGSSVVVRWDVWQRHIEEFGRREIYAGDYDFIAKLFEYKYRVHW